MNKRRLRRIANLLSIVAPVESLQSMLNISNSRCAGSFGSISPEQTLCTIHIIIFHGHFILRQSSCFIRADDRHAAKSFDRLQLTDDRMLLRHLLCAKGKHDGHDGTKRLRDGCHRQRHRK